MIYSKSEALEIAVLKGKTIFKQSLYDYVVDKMRREIAKAEGYSSVAEWEKGREKLAFNFMENLP